MPKIPNTPDNIFRVNDNGIQVRQSRHKKWIDANNLLHIFASGIGQIMPLHNSLPEIGNVFYYVDECGKVIESVLEKSSYHAYLLANGNYYNDKELAADEVLEHACEFKKNINYLYKGSKLRWIVR